MINPELINKFECVIHPDGRLLVRIDDHWFFVDRRPGG